MLFDTWYFQQHNQEIARGDPQKPQTFYPMSHFVHVSPGDYLAGRCTYDTRGEDKVTRIGELLSAELLTKPCSLSLPFFKARLPETRCATCT